MQAIHTAFFLFALVNVVASESECYQKLANAQTAFSTALGITGFDWFSDKRLWEIVEAEYARDIPNGIRNVCTAVKAYKKSLNTDYSRCVNVLQLIRHDDGTPSNVSLVQATQYIAFINHFDFTCGTGFGIFVNSGDNCIGNIFESSAAALGQCRAGFKNQLISNTDPSVVCYYIKDFTTCYQNLFKSCGPIAEYFGCEYGRAPATSAYPHCMGIKTNCRVIVY